ncbi:MAG TPA: hypothetical protein VIU61_00115 [Kofleriaceae bacterium]
MRWVVILGAASACTPEYDVDSYIERGLAKEFGITAEVRCPSVTTKPVPGDEVTCEMTQDGETYRVKLKIDERNHGIVGVNNSDHVLFPVSLMESKVGVRLECPNQRRYLRVAANKPGYCWIVGTKDYLQIVLEDLATEKWSHNRFGMGAAITTQLAPLGLGETITCSEPALVDAAPGTCEVKTKSGEQFQIRFKLGATRVNFVRDGSPVVILPGDLTVKATDEKVSLDCPHRIARADERVRCSYVSLGKRHWVEVAVDAKGVSRFL